MIPEQHKRKAALAAICVACIVPAEGLRRVAYSDPVGIPTICFGETRGVKLGDRATSEQCKEMLSIRVVEDFIPGVERCVKRPMPPEREAAFVSFAYNVGVGRFCESSVVRKYNSGDAVGACDSLLLYTKAAGITLPGLVKRREQERQLCMEGIT